MSIPFSYAVQNLRMRRLTVAATVTGIALVVFVFTAVLMMAYGVKRTLVATGSKGNVKIVRKGANQELSSIIPGDVQSIIRTLPDIKAGDDGVALVSAEPVVIINLNKNDGGLGNVTVRGVSPTAFPMHSGLKIVSGRTFNPNLPELIVGKAISARFEDARVGRRIKIAGNEWEVVGMFTDGGGGYESEIWGNSVQLLQAFNRGNSVSSVTLTLDDPARYGDFKQAFEEDIRLQQFECDTESNYFAKQSEGLAGFIKILGIFVTVVFSLGATVGAMITMYGAVANRTVEIGTMRSLGFSRRSILAVFLSESVLIAVTGALMGIVLASGLSFVNISTMNFSSFSELAFSFALSPSIMLDALLFGASMGIFGGFLPAVRAARMNIVSALRAG